MTPMQALVSDRDDEHFIRRLMGRVEDLESRAISLQSEIDDIDTSSSGGTGVVKICNRAGNSTDLIVATVWKTVLFASANREDTDYFTYSSGEITLGVAGDYEISFHLTTNYPDGTGYRLQGKMQAKASGGAYGDIAGTEVGTYGQYQNVENVTATCSTFVYTAAANDVVKILAKSSRATAEVIPDKSNVFIKFLEAA